MKCLILYAVALAIASSSYCQKTPLTRDDYLRKSKHAKTAAWILFRQRRRHHYLRDHYWPVKQ